MYLNKNTKDGSILVIDLSYNFCKTRAIACTHKPLHVFTAIKNTWYTHIGVFSIQCLACILAYNFKCLRYVFMQTVW